MGNRANSLTFKQRKFKPDMEMQDVWIYRHAPHDERTRPYYSTHGQALPIGRRNSELVGVWRELSVEKCRVVEDFVRTYEGNDETLITGIGSLLKE